MTPAQTGDTVTTPAYVSTLDAEDFHPMTPEELGLRDVYGDPDLRVHELRSTSGADGSVWAAVVTVAPCTFNYTFAGNETVHVLEGHATVEVHGAPTVEMRPGTIASFVKGAQSTWRIDATLREFAVLTDA